MDNPAEVAREVVDANQYMALATADVDGRHWVSPVWFAYEGYTRFVWVSKPEARHSRNIAARGSVAIVVFDSTVAMGRGQALYAEAAAGQVEDREARRWIAVFSDRAEALGGRAWTVEDVTGPAGLRLYLATASAQFVLGPDDERISVSLV